MARSALAFVVVPVVVVPVLVGGGAVAQPALAASSTEAAVILRRRFDVMVAPAAGAGPRTAVSVAGDATGLTQLIRPDCSVR